MSVFDQCRDIVLEQGRSLRANMEHDLKVARLEARVKELEAVLHLFDNEEREIGSERWRLIQKVLRGEENE